MNYKKLITNFKKKNLFLKIYGKVKERGKVYQLYKIIVDNNSLKTLLITAGFHGEEYNGPISLLKMIDEIVDYSKKKKVNLLIYPCVNPSGFDLRQRYNASGEKPNNFFLEYEIKKGKWTDWLLLRQKFLRFRLIQPKAKESRLLKEDLIKWGTVPVGILDIHQDNELPKCDFYAYILDKKELYQKIMAKLDKVGKRCSNATAIMYPGIRPAPSEKIDRDGFIMIHDGTITDMFWRLGSVYSVTVETHTEASLQKVIAINKVWIKTIIDFISKGKVLDKKLNIKFKNYE